MEAKTQDENAAADPAAQDKASVLFTCENETDKKEEMWMFKVTECFSSVLSLFERTDLQTTKGIGFIYHILVACFVCILSLSVVPRLHLMTMRYAGIGIEHFQ